MVNPLKAEKPLFEGSVGAAPPSSDNHPGISLCG